MLHVVKREDVSSISFHGCAWLSTKSPLERLASQTDTEIGRRANSVLYFGRQTFFCYVEIKCDSIKYVIQSSLVLLEIGAENDHSTGKKSKKRYSLYTWSCIMDHFRTIFFFFCFKDCRNTFATYLPYSNGKTAERVAGAFSFTFRARGVIRFLLECNISYRRSRCVNSLIRGDKYRRDTSPKQTARAADRWCRASETRK